MCYIANVRINKLENMLPTEDPYVIVSIPGTALIYETRKQQYFKDLIEFNEGFQIPINDIENQNLKFEVASYENENYTPISLTMQLPIKSIPLDSKLPSPVEPDVLTKENKKVLCKLYAEVSLWSAGPKIQITAELIHFDFNISVFFLVQVYEDTKNSCTLCEVGESHYFGRVDPRCKIEIKIIDHIYQMLVYKVIKINVASINNPEKHAILEKAIEYENKNIGNFVIKFSIPNSDNNRGNAYQKSMNSENNDEIPSEVLQIMMNPMANPMINMLPPNERELYLRKAWTLQTPEYKVAMKQMAQMQNQFQQNPSFQCQPNPWAQFQQFQQNQSFQSQPNPYAQFQQFQQNQMLQSQPNPWAQFQQFLQPNFTNEQRTSTHEYKAYNDNYEGDDDEGDEDYDEDYDEGDDDEYNDDIESNSNRNSTTTKSPKPKNQQRRKNAQRDHYSNHRMPQSQQREYAEEAPQQAKPPENDNLCSFPGCKSRKEYKSNYCKKHTCTKCKNLNQSKFKYCDSCRCPFENCSEPKQSSRNYCFKHSCKYSFCKEPVTSVVEFSTRKATSTFCVNHKCRMDGCKNKIMQSYTPYCSNHNCHKSGCKNPSIKNKHYCAQHC